MILTVKGTVPGHKIYTKTEKKLPGLCSYKKRSIDELAKERSISGVEKQKF